ncbi:tripartite tricarboxylate transporter substrate binding protein [Cocleimonas flava]|uniref:Tripartite-type tricarboxylate transporter receptor subunit TctC n=1 Tax=Cocleimonas flava TaxID=634765 RepID=A0A4R1EY41_9GAMM|nr:tripartite tricarboxylate transporter substrate binding protein [Cocleimonas flava]TCJ84809.1 tripartite-type tricarboxylate transporter receptor subunit TctC [Cocleimonas flava]
MNLRKRNMTKIMSSVALSCVVFTSSVFAEEYPAKPISAIISYGAGGNTDVGARILFPNVEKELGAALTILNKPGGGGWVGWTNLLNSKNDGYTIGYINTPNLITGYLNPLMKRDKSLEDFDLIANHVTDYGVISINKDEKRFTNIKELVEYAKANTLTVSTTGANGDDHIAMLKMNQKFGTKFVPVHTKGSAKQRAAIQGGHVDVGFSNVGDTNNAHKNGELKVVAVMAEERSNFLKDVPTLAESGFPGVVSWSARGIAAPKGLSAEQLEKLRESFIKGMNAPEHLKKMEEMGLQVDIKTGDDYKKMLMDEEQGVIELKPILGW